MSTDVKINAVWPLAVVQRLPWWAWVAWWVAYWLGSNAVAAMEAPTATTTARYRFWFRYLNLLAANASRSKLWNRGGNGQV